MVQKGEIPDRITRLGLPFTHCSRVPLLGGAVRLVNGSGSKTTAYLEIPFYEAKPVNVLGRPTDLKLMIEGDPEVTAAANYIQRLKKEAAVIAVGKTSLEHVIKETKGQAAIAVKIGNVVAAGVFPNGTADLGKLRPWEYTAGLRTGTADFPGDYGAFIKEENLFVVSDGSFVVEQRVPITELHDRYWTTPLV